MSMDERALETVDKNSSSNTAITMFTKTTFASIIKLQKKTIDVTSSGWDLMMSLPQPSPVRVRYVCECMICFPGGRGGHMLNHIIRK